VGFANRGHEKAPWMKKVVGIKPLTILLPVGKINPQQLAKSIFENKKKLA